MSTFTDDPLVSPSGQFALAMPAAYPPSLDGPSPVGVRPWGLRRMGPVLRPGKTPAGWRFDPVRQLCVDESDTPLLALPGSAGPPTAPTTPPTDGEDPPSSEDWINDFHPDTPGLP